MENTEFCYREVWSPTLSASAATLPAETETAYKWSLPQINLYPLYKRCPGHFVVKFPVHGMTSPLMTWGSHTAYTDMEKHMRTRGHIFCWGVWTGNTSLNLMVLSTPFQHLPLLEQSFIITMKLTNAETHCFSWKKPKSLLNSLSELLLLQ